MNKRQRKKAKKKAWARAFSVLAASWPEPDLPCDNPSCSSCYRSAGPHYAFLE